MSALAAVPLPHRTAIYCRISRDATGQAAGVERQEGMCRELVDRLGWEVTEVIVDNDLSAFSGVTRPGYERLLTLIEAGDLDAVVAYHPDRLYRRLLDLSRLTRVIENHKVEVRTVAAGDVDLSTASGRFTAQVLGAAAEHENARTGERVSAKHAANARAGKFGGGPRPYGFERAGPGQLEIKDDEAEIIREMAARVLSGASISSLVRELNQRKVPTSTGSHWRDPGLRFVLVSPRIAGLVPSGKEGDYIGPANWPPIVERAEWERLKQVLAVRKRGRKPRSFLLSGMIWCGNCQYRLHSALAGDKQPDAPYRRIYRCERSKSGPQACQSVGVSADPLEGYVIERVLAAAEGADLASVRAEATVSERVRLVHEIADDEAMLNELAAQMGARTLSRAEWISARPPIEERLRENRGRLAAMGGESVLPPQLVSIDRAKFDALTFEGQRALLQLFVERITVNKLGRRTNRFESDRVVMQWKA